MLQSIKRPVYIFLEHEGGLADSVLLLHKFTNLCAIFGMLRNFLHHLTDFLLPGRILHRAKQRHGNLLLQQVYPDRFAQGPVSGVIQNVVLNLESDSEGVCIVMGGLQHLGRAVGGNSGRSARHHKEGSRLAAHYPQIILHGSVR